MSQIIDGFLFNTRLKCNLQFLPMALDQYEPLRRAGAFKTWILTVPEDPQSSPIPAFDAFEYQTRCKPGSTYWAYSLIGAAGSFSVQITDSCTDVPLFSEVILSTGDSNAVQCPLPRLLIVPEPGLLNVQICNLTSENVTGVQFILWGGQPV
jgi:hypothetical protein